MLRELDFTEHGVTDLASGLKRMSSEDPTQRNRQLLEQFLDMSLIPELTECVEACRHDRGN